MLTHSIQWLKIHSGVLFSFLRAQIKWNEQIRGNRRCRSPTELINFIRCLVHSARRIWVTIITSRVFVEGPSEVLCKNKCGIVTKFAVCVARNYVITSSLGLNVKFDFTDGQVTTKVTDIINKKCGQPSAYKVADIKSLANKKFSHGWLNTEEM